MADAATRVAVTARTPSVKSVRGTGGFLGMSLTPTTAPPLTHTTAIQTTPCTRAMPAMKKNKRNELDPDAFREKVAEAWGRKIVVAGEYRGRSKKVRVRCSACGKIHERTARYVAEGFSFDCRCGRLHARKRKKNSRAERDKRLAKAAERMRLGKPAPPSISDRMTADQILSTFGARK